MNFTLVDSLREFRGRWKHLFLADGVYKIIAFVLLTPLVALLFRFFLGGSARNVLADQDILLFFLSPSGGFCLIVVGALWLGILALELATLLAILAAPEGHSVRLRDALRFSYVNAWAVIRLTARLIAWTSLVAAPFLAVMAAIYFTLLSEFDINYYLSARPPVFFVALGLAAVVSNSLLAVLLHLFSGWLFALPLVLFEGISPREAMRLSRKRASGGRRKILIWIASWALTTLAISAIATAAVTALVRLLVPLTANSPGLMRFAIGASLSLWACVHLAVSLLGMTTLATLHSSLYRHALGGGTINSSRLDTTRATGGEIFFRLTAKRLMAFCFSGVVVALAVGIIAVGGVRMEDDVQVIAHRGSSKAAPENTLAAVKRAIEDGADWVEIDVQETADGEVVVFHDSDFMKLAGLDMKIWNATMTDLRDIDIGTSFDPAFHMERVPTLSAVLEECKGKVGLYIELKYYGHDERLEERVVNIVETHEMSANVVFMSLDLDAVQKMKSLRPDWRVGLLMSVSAGRVRDIKADFLAVNAAFASRSFIRAAQRSGKNIRVWTVNDAFAMSTMISRGVDGIITDLPALARSVIELRSEMTAPERLFIALADIFGVELETAPQ